MVNPIKTNELGGLGALGAINEIVSFRRRMRRN